MTPRPTITLITICRNAEATLERTITSVLNQKTRPEEYLFVDGGSTDKTVEILQNSLPRLQQAGISARILFQKHEPDRAGIPEAWNQGILQAKGEIIALLNADDWYTPQALETAVRLFLEYPQAMGIALPVQLIRPDGHPDSILRPAALPWTEIKMPLPHPGCFLRKELYQTVGLYDTRYGISADYDLIWRIRNAGLPLHYGTGAEICMQTGGLANTSRAQARRETLAIALRHSRWKLPAILAFLLRWLTRR